MSVLTKVYVNHLNCIKHANEYVKKYNFIYPN